ncbi:OmpH family outer membrane protein [Arenibacter sp. M-2]|uniref:OmpH family outer membrane protein n=1 Tax=unclassified Arenibacter TaxID=2615047 RepID=UPI000D759065|nr:MULTISPECIES: OmpH family outer membrane protein [unclassified Arenibacter]MDL5513180.1 OmpH family outer membrane protein [Arenibacter sp. M-2]PXX28957.1 periplasmic chaperone for outer membrane proteins Skp [Arenibacter sp. ARW7G5Y1]|tara:strand:- start:2520 stop:3029 length:510 start_codon:yes stop_codon:yes gene_type:complete
MKQIKKIAVAIVLLVAATSFVNAQAKIAHIDVQKLLSEMPEMKAADAELKKLQETYRADIESSMTELKNKYTQYSNESSSKSEEENQKRALELQGFEKNIGEAQQTAQQELQKKQAELLGPITEKAKKAIETVAAAQGIDYVMDATQGGGLIVAKGKDILPDVKKQLGF